jgi:hypothetical protein
MMGLAAAGNAATYIECTISQEELAKIPTARDPWAVLQAMPGVQIDRLVIGYDEIGLQGPYVGPDSSGEQSVWSVGGTVVIDLNPAAPSELIYSTFDDFEELRTTLLEAEIKALCEEVEWADWEGITLERVLRAASSQEEALVKADAHGLLRGFIALLLHDKGCAEPPADVLAEAREYGRRFGLPSSDRLPEP